MNCIAAVDGNWAIGKGGKLLVSIPEDMKYFRTVTAGKTLIYGRKTLLSFPGGQVLKNRRNIILSTQTDFSVPGAEIVHSAEEALKAVENEDPDNVFVIGGASVYQLMLPYCSAAYITKIDYPYEADTYFPNLDRDPAWVLAEEGEEKTYFDLVYEFDIYRRK